MLAQQKLYKGFYGILAYTFVKSEFTDGTGTFKPSAWDVGHIVSLTGGKKLKRNWEIGVRWRFTGGAPFTPINVLLSSQKEVWDVAGRGIPDYSLLNTQRLNPAHGLDVRIDKRWYFTKWTLNTYIDVQNVYNFQAQQPPFLNVIFDDNGNPLSNPDMPGFYQTRLINDFTGTVLPSLGIMIEF